MNKNNLSRVIIPFLSVLTVCFSACKLPETGGVKTAAADNEFYKCSLNAEGGPLTSSHTPVPYTINCEAKQAEVGFRNFTVTYTIREKDPARKHQYRNRVIAETTPLGDRQVVFAAASPFTYSGTIKSQTIGGAGTKTITVSADVFYPKEAAADDDDTPKSAQTMFDEIKKEVEESQQGMDDTTSKYKLRVSTGL